MYDETMKAAEDTRSSPVEDEIARLEKAASDVLESVALLMRRLAPVLLSEAAPGETGVNAVAPERCVVEIRLAQVRDTLDTTIVMVHNALPRLQV